jgi:hypothetical protein
VVLAATAPIEDVEKIVGLVDVGDRPPLVLAGDPEVAELLIAAAAALARRVRNVA